MDKEELTDLITIKALKNDNIFVIQLLKNCQNYEIDQILLIC